MVNLVARGYRLLNRVIEPASAETVRYTRSGTVISDTMLADITAVDIEQVLDGEVTIVGRQQTMWVERAALRWEGEPTKPKRGDLIEWYHDGATYTFEALADNAQIEAGAVDPRKDWVPVSVKLLNKVIG